jgi:hypothetical protein
MASTTAEVVPSQNNYSVTYHLQYSQDPAVGSQLVLENAIRSVRDIWQVLVTSQTPSFVLSQLRQVETAWQNAAWQDDYNDEVARRYFGLLREYLDHYAQQGFFSSVAAQNILEQLESLEPYLI